MILRIETLGMETEINIYKTCLEEERSILTTQPKTNKSGASNNM